MHTVEWFNTNTRETTVSYEFNNLQEARTHFNDECWNLRTSSIDDQENTKILLKEIDENGDDTVLEQFSI